MEKEEFLTQNIFDGVKNMNDGFDDEEKLYFSASDFEIILQKIEHFGIGIYTIETRLEKEAFEKENHEQYRKKSTDPKWYNKAFSKLKRNQEGLLYSANYRVSKKLLER